MYAFAALHPFLMSRLAGRGWYGATQNRAQWRSLWDSAQPHCLILSVLLRSTQAYASRQRQACTPHDSVSVRCRTGAGMRMRLRKTTGPADVAAVQLCSGDCSRATST
eukprot:361975-Chlamydomonas_euryale.AAC.3